LLAVLVVQEVTEIWVLLAVALAVIEQAQEQQAVAVLPNLLSHLLLMQVLQLPLAVAVLEQVAMVTEQMAAIQFSLQSHQQVVAVVRQVRVAMEVHL
jgi:hypothetical protein